MQDKVSTLSEPPQIPGYRIQDEIGRGAKGIVYRARRGDLTFAIKLQEDPEDRTLFSYGAILACIHHPGLPEIVEVGEAGDRAYLVREFVPGYTLAAELEAGALEESRIVEIGKTLAGALDQVHRHGLIHRDVKPANILLSREGKVHLIDFGFATRIHASKHSTVGTYLYSAPEQMKALQAPIDQRSDLYALGAVLYACATGEPPYSSDDTAQLLLLHASAPIPKIHDKNHNISPALCLILEKLLSKDPRDRYPTGASLLADLRALKSLNAKLESGQEVGLAESQRELTPQTPPMVGRDSELVELEAPLGEVMTGKGRSVLLRGEGGSGKTLLAQTFLRRAERARPMILRARCEGGQAPYASVRDWTEDYFRQLQYLPGPQRELIEKRLKALNEEAAGLLSRLGHKAQEFFGSDDRSFEVEESDYFLEAVAHFFLELAKLHGVLILSLEDVHHLDEGGLQLTRRLRAAYQHVPLLLLATSRCSERERKSLKAYLEAALPSTVIHLEALERSEIEVLIFSLLGSRPVSPELIRQVQVRSQGNPFAATEYLRSMLRNGVVLPTPDGWRIDDRALHTIELPDDVLDLVLQRVAQLDSSVHSLLRTAAVYGVRFRTDILERFAPCAPALVEPGLEVAANAHILESLGANTYVFVHDRLREAFLAELTSQESKKIHRDIAQGLQALAGAHPELKYAIARHYALADSSTSDSYQSNLSAGQMALKDFAFEDAYRYLSVAREHGGEDWLEPLSLACERTGRTEEGIELLKELQKKPSDPVKQAEVLMRLSYLCLSKLDRTEAKRDCIEALKVIGKPLRRSGKFKDILLAATCFARWILPELRGKGSRVKSNNPRRDLIMSKLYQDLSQSEFFDMNYAKMIEMGSRACLAGSRLGDSPQRLVTYANFLIPFGMAGGRKYVDFWMGRLNEMAEDLGDPISKNHLEVIHKVALHMAGGGPEVDQALELFLRQRSHLMEAWVYLIGVADLAWIFLMRGETEKAWTWVQRGIERSKLSSSQGGVERDLDILACYALSCLAILGRPGEAAGFIERVKWQVEEAQADKHLAAAYYGHLLLFHRECAELGDPARLAQESFLALRISPRLAPLYRRHYYVAAVYHWLDRCLKSESHPEDLQGLDEAIELLRQSARHPILKAHLQHALGARLYHQAKYEQALQALSEAQQQADRHNMPWVSFEVARSKARVYRKLKLEEVALREARLAYGLAKDFAWPQRARKVAAEFSFHRSTQSISTSRSTSLGGREDAELASQSRLQRQLEALLRLSLASAKVMGPLEQARVALDELINLLRAERAYIFLVGEDKLEFLTGRDRDGATLSGPTGYSRTVIEAVDLTREPVVLAGTEEGLVLGAESVVAHDLRSIICAPLAIREQFVGVIYLDNRLARGVFTHEDIEILNALSSHIAVSLETARISKLEMEVQAERRRRELAVTLQDFTSSLTSTQDPEEIQTLLRETLQKSLPWRRMALWQCEDQELRLISLHGFPSDQPPERSLLRRDSSTIERVVSSARPLWEPSLIREPGLEDLLSQEESFQWVGLPLIADRRVIALAGLSFEQSANFSEDEVEVAFAFCSQAAIALSNAHMFQEIKRFAITDALTGLSNRRHFFQQAEQLLTRFPAGGERQVWLSMMDVDHFKKFNDSYGHAAGDEVLKRVAEILRNLVGEDMIAARFGGEEFVFLSASPKVTGVQVAQNIRAQIEAEVLPFESQELRVTMSLGVASVKDGDSLTSLLKRADEQLYQAKTKGRNQVCVI